MTDIKIPIVVIDSASSALAKITTGFKKLSTTADSTAGKIAKNMNKGFDHFKQNGKAVLEGVAKGFAIVTAAAIGAGVAFVSLAKDASKLQNLKELYKGSPETLQRMRDFAKDAGIEFEAASEAMNKLGKAWKPSDAEELLKVIGDLSAKSNLGAEGVKQLSDEFAELGGKASVNQGDFEKFQKIIGSNVVTLDALAIASGKSLKQVTNELEKGTFSAAEFAAGLREAGAGSKDVGQGALEKGAKTIEGQLNKIGTIWETFKTNLFNSFGGEAKAVEVLKSFADGLAKILSQENITAFFDGLAKAVKWVRENFDSIKPILVGIGVLLAGTILVSVVAVTAAFIAANATIIAVSAGIVGAVSAIYAIVDNWSEIWGFIKESVIGVWDSIGAYFSALPDKFMTFGSDIMNGLLEGIIGGAKAVVDAVINVANSAKDAFTNILDINSPSKVFEGYGKNTADGYSQGLDQGQASVEDSSSDLADSSKKAMIDELSNSFNKQSETQPTVDNTSQIFQRQPTVNNKTTNNTSSPTVNITVNVEANATADETKIKTAINSIIPSLVDALNRASLAGSGY